MEAKERASVRASTIVSYAALMLSLCGVVVSVFQTRIMIAQQRAMVWPHLQFWTSDMDGFSLSVDNSGLGPAIVRSVDLTLGDEHFSSFAGFGDGLKHRAIEKGLKLSELSTIHSGVEHRTVRAGDAVKVLWFKGPQPLAFALEEFTHETDWDFRLVYSSIHDQCWELTRHGERALDRCP